jgi:hypothetical protein
MLPISSQHTFLSPTSSFSSQNRSFTNPGAVTLANTYLSPYRTIPVEPALKLWPLIMSDSAPLSNYAPLSGSASHLGSRSGTPTSLLSDAPSSIVLPGGLLADNSAGRKRNRATATPPAKRHRSIEPPKKTTTTKTPKVSGPALVGGSANKFR